jgi:hypothetical protein
MVGSGFGVNSHVEAEKPQTCIVSKTERDQGARMKNLVMIKFHVTVILVWCTPF